MSCRISYCYLQKKNVSTSSQDKYKCCTSVCEVVLCRCVWSGVTVVTNCHGIQCCVLWWLSAVESTSITFSSSDCWPSGTSVNALCVQHQFGLFFKRTSHWYQCNMVSLLPTDGYRCALLDVLLSCDSMMTEAAEESGAAEQIHDLMKCNGIQVMRCSHHIVPTYNLAFVLRRTT